jgi:hypothetical protein
LAVVTRVPAAFVAVTLAGFALLVAFAGCRQQAVEHAPERNRAQPETPAARAEPSRLPEDPVAGKRSEAQWREHMVAEERERQLGFDSRHLKEHKAVVNLIAAARVRYDRAKTEASVAKVRADMPRRITDIRRRVTEIDRWGVNSRLLQDYDALAVSLTDAYAEAKIAAIKGDAHTLDEVRAGFDQRMKKITDWLTEAKAGEDE